MDSRIVLPALRVADLIGDGVQFLHRALFRYRRHPIQFLDILAERLLEVSDHFERALFAFLAERPLDVFLAERLTEFVIFQLDAALPAWPHLLGSRQNRAVKAEGLLDD